MKQESVKSPEQIEAAVYLYGDRLFRLCFIMLGSRADAEDAVQETMIRYMQKAPAFENAEHEKAWLITTAKNKCRDMLRFRFRHPQIDLDELQSFAVTPSESSLLETLMQLPDKYRLVLALYYVEEYRVEEIATMIQRSSSAVKMRLQKGRRLLKEAMRKEIG